MTETTLIPTYLPITDSERYLYILLAFVNRAWKDSDNVIAVWPRRLDRERRRKGLRRAECKAPIRVEMLGKQSSCVLVGGRQ